MKNNQKHKIISWGNIPALVMAIATVVIAYAYISQIGIMKGTLDIMEENLRVARMPLLEQKLHPDPSKHSIVDYQETEEGGERWSLPYFVMNAGMTAAHKFSYFHKFITRDSIAMPKDEYFVNYYKENVIFPFDILDCGFDQILRQTVLDSINAGKKYYRHFIIRYSDEFHNEYIYHTVWVLAGYQKGTPLDFRLISRRRLK
jgi:hypothetical protein